MTIETQRLPPHRQRRLNVKIKESFGDRYADWFEYAEACFLRGDTLSDVQNSFRILGIEISIGTLHGWLRVRRQSEQPGKAA